MYTFGQSSSSPAASVSSILTALNPLVATGAQVASNVDAALKGQQPTSGSPGGLTPPAAGAASSSGSGMGMALAVLAVLGVGAFLVFRSAKKSR